MKRNRAKIILTIFIAILASILLLTGCHKKYDLAQLAKEEAEAQAAEESAESQNTTDSEGENSEESKENDEAEEEKDVSAPSTILGNTTSNSYSNSYYGLKFSAPNNDWYLASDSELAQVMNQKNINDEVLLKVLNETGFIMDMYAVNTSADADSDIFDSVSVTIENISKLYSVILTEQELADASLPSIKNDLSAQGGKNVKAEVIETVVAGSPRVCISSSADMDKSKIYQKMVYIKKDTFVACITVTSFGSDKTDSILKAFAAL